MSQLAPVAVQRCDRKGLFQLGKGREGQTEVPDTLREERAKILCMLTLPYHDVLLVLFHVC